MVLNAWKRVHHPNIIALRNCYLSNGAVFFVHDFYPTSVEAALEIVDRLQGEGYTFVTVEELFRIRGVTPQAGLLYASPDRLRPLEAG